MRLPLTYLVIACLAGVLLSEGRAANEYRDAKPDRPVFDDDELGLMIIEREKLATELAAYVCNDLGRGGAMEGEGASEGTSLANRMLGVALQLHPRNRTALIANFRLTRGVPTDFAASDYEPKVLADYLYTRSKLLMEQGGDTNDNLAAYLLAFAVEIDPTNEDAIYDLEVRSIDEREPDWGLILPWLKEETVPEVEIASGEVPERMQNPGTEKGAPTSGPAKPSGKKVVPPPSFGGWPLISD